jgi:hypothetical protein
MAMNQNSHNGNNIAVDAREFNFTIPPGLSAKELLKKLTDTRSQLEELKSNYKHSWSEKKKIILHHEILRVANAVSTIKNQLVLDGVRFKHDIKDIETPEAAAKRFWL